VRESIHGMEVLFQIVGLTLIKQSKIILGQRNHPSDVFGYLQERDKKGHGSMLFYLPDLQAKEYI
jgi:hypothetical protein